MIQAEASAGLNLGQFRGGTGQWYRHGLVRKVLYTDGVQYVAETVGAYWLIDSIAIHQMHTKAVKAEPFQVWKLEVAEDQSAKLSCEDGNNNVVFTEQIPYTDFPAEGVTLWFTDNTILLPVEY